MKSLATFSRLFSQASTSYDRGLMASGLAGAFQPGLNDFPFSISPAGADLGPPSQGAASCAPTNLTEY
jgi:hypothetical protein